MTDGSIAEYLCMCAAYFNAGWIALTSEGSGLHTLQHRLQDDVASQLISQCGDKVIRGTTFAYKLQAPFAVKWCHVSLRNGVGGF